MSKKIYSSWSKSKKVTTLKHLAYSAKCTTPAQCLRCGKILENSLGHSWRAATCTTPKKCSRCHITSGYSLGHSWEAATCETPKTCSRCRTTSGKSAGHNYNNGVCTKCNKKDPNKIYSAGETWVADDGRWKLTINSVTSHNLCNSYTNSKHGYTNEQVVIISYTYENINYTTSIGSSLAVTDLSLDVYDETGETGEMYACTHVSGAKYAIPGTRCTATTDFVLNNRSSYVLISLNHHGDTGLFKVKVD